MKANTRSVHLDTISCVQKSLFGRGGLEFVVYIYMLTLRLQFWFDGCQFSCVQTLLLACCYRWGRGWEWDPRGFEILCHRDEELECWI